MVDDDDVSETEFSLGDESSFHPSEYSVSSIEESPTTKSKHEVRRGSSKATSRSSSNSRSRIQIFKAEVVSSQQESQHYLQQQQTKMRPATTHQYPSSEKKSNSSILEVISSSSSGSSCSPWLDGTGSSSSTSSKGATDSILLLSIDDQIRCDNARKRLRESQKRQRPLIVTKKNHDSLSGIGVSLSSSISVCTGKDPNKPIDVTGVEDIANGEPSLLGSTSIRQHNSKLHSTRDQGKIVGLSRPANNKHEERGCDKSKKSYDRRRSSSVIFNTKKKVNGTTYPPRLVPPIIAPEFCTSQHINDDISSIAIVSLSPYTTLNKNKRAKYMHDRQQKVQEQYRNDIEYGRNKFGNTSCTVDSAENMWCTSIGQWIEQRTNLELLLIFVATMSSVGLIALLTLIFAN